MFIQEVIESLKSIKDSDLNLLKNAIETHDQVIIIGNGGSNAIASHISQDYTKVLQKKSFSFSDPSRLTCYINDYGVEKAYSQFLREFSTDKTLVILISSSGNSPNIISCAQFCTENKVRFITLTGFDEHNKIRANYAQHSIIDFWVNSKDYGIVECVHQIILHTPTKQTL